ncbi:hypothetical protein HYE82_06510 [Streptomyces sp. BR123]|uniref:DUF6381 family protein n=1 Tax=Streptomyces sp. BR123 TaxID=2749828 RepID=UPI0015C4BD4A|nr:DUF6381 family protein [Streptomyces sp. BR123]NXY94051.1 hypothetical protein [Streptomyces sp. BR123]
MSSGNQPSEQARRMREEAEELELEAQRATDPEARQRLTEKALRIREKIEQDNGPESATMDPM